MRFQRFMLLSVVLCPYLRMSAQYPIWYCNQDVTVSACFQMDFSCGEFVYELSYDDGSCGKGRGRIHSRKQNVQLLFDPLDSLAGIQVKRAQTDSLTIYVTGYEAYTFPAAKITLQDMDTNTRQIFYLMQGMTVIPIQQIHTSWLVEVTFMDGTTVGIKPASLVGASQIILDPDIWIDSGLCRSWFLVTDQVMRLKKHREIFEADVMPGVGGSGRKYHLSQP
ncbi:MAG: hypothetical protein SF053_01180 [Bacteroidia bacterium]|nr:hypothetical protein [Bacteroidia bacterium]